MSKQADKLHNKAAKLWKEVCFLRDGQQCQVQKFFPFLKTTHAGYLQIDHWISRSNKNFFYDTRNGTVVCGGCNLAKKYRNNSVDRAIDYIVAKRIGKEVVARMIQEDMQDRPNLNFNKIEWLEEVIKELEREKSHYLSHNK